MTVRARGGRCSNAEAAWVRCSRAALGRDGGRSRRAWRVRVRHVKGLAEAPVGGLEVDADALDVRVADGLGHDHEVVVVAVLDRVLQDGKDRGAVLGEDLADRRDDTLGVAEADTDVEGGVEGVDELEVGRRLLGEGLGCVALRDRQDVRHARVGRGVASGALTDEDGLLQRGGVDHHGVGGAVDVVEDRVLGDEHGRDERRDARLVLGVHLGHTQDLDRASDGLGVLEVGRLDLLDAPARDLVLVDVDAEGELHHDLELGARVEATHVQRRVRLRVPERRRLRQRVLVREAAHGHIGQDEVGAAVDDARELLHVVADKVALERVDDRDATTHGRLEPELHRLLAVGVDALQQRVDRRQLLRDQGLVRGHDVLARLERRGHDVLGERRAAHHLDHHVDVRGLGHVLHVASQLAPCRQLKVAGLVGVADDDLFELDVDAELLLAEVGLFGEDLHDAAADGAAAHQADIHHLWRALHRNCSHRRPA